MFLVTQTKSYRLARLGSLECLVGVRGPTYCCFFCVSMQYAAVNISLALCMGTDVATLANSSQPMAQILLNSLDKRVPWLFGCLLSSDSECPYISSITFHLSYVQIHDGIQYGDSCLGICHLFHVLTHSRFSLLHAKLLHSLAMVRSHFQVSSTA